MPPQPQAAARTAPRTGPRAGLVIDRTTHTIRLTRVFDATRAEIFAAWTKPEHVTHWWDAAGEPLAVCEIDLRLGGQFKFVSKSHPEMPFAGTYSEITPPDRLIFEAMGATGRVVLKEAAGKTHLTVEIACRSAAELDQFVKMGVDVGTSQTLDNLVTYSQRARLADESNFASAFKESRSTVDPDLKLGF
jgi:uncharacterized protein YndB with AHSA1/START domain